MSRLALTPEQIRAATSRHKRLFIEANPGSGKTTVAAERYGVVRFDSQGDRRATIAVSFTRSATAELRDRITGRWGGTALVWPNGASTIDGIIYNIVQHFLRKGILKWPGGHTSLEVLDDWRGHAGYRWLTSRSVRRKLSVNSRGEVTSTTVSVPESRFGFGDKASFHKHLTSGRCTHDDIRDALASALNKNAEKQQVVVEYLSQSVSHLIVDEVFDANRLDLGLVLLASRANIDVTLVGDPWQALYGFRGSKPDLVPSVLKGLDFKTLPLTESFRFQSDETRTLAKALRNREGASIGSNGPFDVVLALKWDTLWSATNRVLPMSFGRAANITDAIVTLLLDHLVHSSFGVRATFLPEALAILELDPDAYRAQGPSVLGGIADSLKANSGSTAAKDGLHALREAVKAMGGSRRPRSGTAAAEARQTDRLIALSQRLRATELVPGLTVHQAKGREWNRVGLLLKPDETAVIQAGLDPSIESHRTLYVALTRARLGVTRVV